MGDGGGGHCLVRMEWRPSRWSVYLPLLIFPCTRKSRSFLLAPAHPGGPGKRAVKWLCVCVCVCNVRMIVILKIKHQIRQPSSQHIKTLVTWRAVKKPQTPFYWFICAFNLCLCWGPLPAVRFVQAEILHCTTCCWLSSVHRVFGLWLALCFSPELFYEWFFSSFVLKALLNLNQPSRHLWFRIIC